MRRPRNLDSASNSLKTPSASNKPVTGVNFPTSGHMRGQSITDGMMKGIHPSNVSPKRFQMTCCCCFAVQRVFSAFCGIMVLKEYAQERGLILSLDAVKVDALS